MSSQNFWIRETNNYHHHIHAVTVLRIAVVLQINNWLVHVELTDLDGLIITLRTRGTGTDDGKSAFGSRVVTLDAPVNRINGSKLKCVDLSWIEPENDGFRTLDAKKAHHSPSCIAVHVSPRRRKQMSIVSESYFNRSWVPNYLSFHHNRTFPIRPFCDPQQRIRIVGSE